MDDKVTTFTLMALDFTAYNKEPDKHTENVWASIVEISIYVLLLELG